MKAGLRYITIFCLSALFPLIPLLSDAADMNDYTLIPPFISTIVTPNILLVLDESGSMQFPAYLGCDWNYYSSSRARCGSDTSTTDPGSSYDYDYSADEPIRDYYGYFDPEKYYEYDSGNSKFIESASAGCSFAEGTLGYKIGDDSGDCISGNILNWAAMSRIDLLRKALMGGKSVAQVGNTHTLRGEGGLRTFTDANLDCTFNISGGTYPALDHVLSISTSGGAVCTPDAVYSDDFNDTTVDAKWTALDIGDASGGSESEDGAELNVRSTGSSIWNNSDSFRYVYQSVSGDFDIRLRVIDPPNTNDNAKAALMVRNTNAADSAHVMIAHRGHGSWDERLQFAYRDTTGGSTSTFNSNIYRRSPEWVRLVRTGNTFMAYYSNAGTVWTYVASVTVTDMSDPVLIGIANASYSSSYGTGEYDEFVYCATVAGGCAVGTLSDALIRVDTDDRKGVIQRVSDKDNDGLYDENSPRFGVEVFASNSRYGCIRESFTDTLADIISAIEDEVPYAGTPTKAGLEEAWDYFAQNNANGNCNNISFIDPATAIDPFYTDDPANPGSLIPVPCKASYVLLISDGEYSDGTGEPVPVARDSHIDDIRTPLVNDLSGTQIIDYYSFFIFGSTGAGRNSMQQIAMFGAFDDDDNDTWPYDRTSTPADSRTVTLPYGTPPNTICDPLNPPMDDQCKEWDRDGPGGLPDGIPDTYFEATSGKELEDKLVLAISDILERASSGTASSVLASSQGKGANLLQAVFYPEQRFFDAEISWIGTLSNLWYYIDPFLLTSSIREDTDRNSILHLINDYVVEFYFDDNPNERKTRVKLYEDTTGKGTPLVEKDDVEFEELKNIWDAGILLWNRDITPITGNPRIIKTTIGSGMMDFSTGAGIPATLKPYLQAADVPEAEAIIRYIHGEDTIAGGGFINPSIAGFTGEYRPRTVAIDLNKDDDVDDTVDNISESAKVWKLGDIVHSTPKIVTWVPLNQYDTVYKDKSYKNYYRDLNADGTPKTTPVYTTRGLAFTGANDGMLHAFKYGTLQLKEDPDWNAQSHEEARILNPDTSPLAPCSSSDTTRCGEEVWSFIPENVLPYLKYFADPGYGHIYTVDATPYIIDVSIGDNANLERAEDGTSWRTVLIGSLRLGGASRGSNAAYTNCVYAPGADLDGDGTIGAGEDKKGTSSYFAIDITDPDPNNWTLLWEFSNEDIPSAELSTGGLGFSTAGMSVARINATDCKNAGGDVIDSNLCNGEWLVVIPSGPTGPIDTTVHQFMGRSNQNLKLFVLDLRDGALKKTINTGISNAFGGSAFVSTVDPDKDYQDDAIYLGYTYSKNGIGDTWTTGGVLRIFTLNNLGEEDPDPDNWTWSKVMDDIGPVVTSVDRLEYTEVGAKAIWLFFGTGRYYYKLPNVVDDASTRRKLFGIKDPCYVDGAFVTTCSDTVAESVLLDVTDNAAAAEDDEGWFINLDAENDPAGFGAERVITNPVASITGCVFFTTFKPSTDICGFGGKTHLWAVNYNTGGAPDCRALVLMQLSTGSVEKKIIKPIDDPNPEPLPERDGRRTGAMDGAPPPDNPPPIFTLPPGIKKGVHFIER